MNYLTDRKRAQGTGAGGEGTHHHWQMMVSSAALVILVPLFVFVFANGLGKSYEEVLAYYSRPFPAIVTGLTMVVVILHLCARDTSCDRRLCPWCRRKAEPHGRRGVWLHIDSCWAVCPDQAGSVKRAVRK